MSKLTNINTGILTAALAVVGAGLISMSAYAANNSFYVSTTGDDSGSCSQASPCKTIQYAVDQAGDDDTVIVASGTYEQSSAVSINRTKNLTLTGNNAIIKPQGGNTVGIAVRGPGTTIKGFTFDGSQAGDTIKGISLGQVGGANPAQPTDATITDNKFINLNGGVSNSNAQIDASGLVIKGNTFIDNNRPGSANGSNGIYINKAHGSGLLIEGNDFSGSEFGGSSSAMQISGIEGNKLQDITIRNNTSDNDGELLFIFLVDNATVEGNTGQNEARDQAVRIGLDTTNLDFSDNTIKNSTGGISILNYPTARATSPSSNVTIKGNTVTGIENAAVLIEDGAILDGIEVVYNSFSNNGSGIVNQSSQSIVSHDNEAESGDGEDDGEAAAPGVPDTGVASPSGSLLTTAILAVVATAALALGLVYRRKMNK